LPKHIDTVELNERLTEERISIAPGILFTASKKYRHCLRLNYAQETNEEIRQAIETIGDAVNKQ